MKPNREDHIRYFDRYIDLVPEEDILTALAANHREMLDFIQSIPAGKADYRYAEGKWSILQVIRHIIDTERIFSYRALCFARGEKQVLPGYDENEYADAADMSHSSLAIMAEEFDLVRKSTISLARQMSEKEWLSKGRAASGEVNVLSLMYVICGHATHHARVIQEKYLHP